jgi:hypothetical protein
MLLIRNLIGLGVDWEATRKNLTDENMDAFLKELCRSTTLNYDSFRGILGAGDDSFCKKLYRMYLKEKIKPRLLNGRMAVHTDPFTQYMMITRMFLPGHPDDRDLITELIANTLKPLQGMTLDKVCHDVSNRTVYRRNYPGLCLVTHLAGTTSGEFAEKLSDANLDPTLIEFATAGNFRSDY